MILLYLLLYYLGLILAGSVIFFIIFKLPQLIKYYFRHTNESSGFYFVYGGTAFKDMVLEKEHQWQRFVKMKKILEKYFNGQIIYVNNGNIKYWRVLYGVSGAVALHISEGPKIPHPGDDVTPEEFEQLLILMYRL